MKIMSQPVRLSIKSVWEDLVEDFLEVGCLLSNGEREPLMDELREERVTSESIESHPVFSINGTAVVVSRGEAPRECWFYDTRSGKVHKYQLKK